MGASRTMFLFSILCFFISSCTPYWENEIEVRLDHKQITQNANKKSENLSLENASSKKIATAENSSELQTSALKLNDKTNELSKEIDDLLTHFNEL